MKKKFIGKNSKIRNFLREKLKFARKKPRNYRRFWELWKLHLNLKRDIELWRSGENATKNTKKWQNAKFWTENPQKRTKRTTSKRTKRKKTKNFFSQFIVDIPFRFSRYGNGVKGENKNYLKFFVKTLYKKKIVWYYVDEKAYRLP